jgi:DNA-binding MarR family transcriptional regulator
MSPDRKSTDAALHVADRVLSQCVGARLRTLNRVVTRIYDDQLRPLGIRFSQMNVLMLIVGRGPMTPAEIGAVLALEKSTLSRNLRVLEDQGWIVRRPDGSRASVKLEATTLGRETIVEAEVLWQAGQQAALDLLGTSQCAGIRIAFDRVQRHSKSS